MVCPLLFPQNTNQKTPKNQFPAKKTPKKRQKTHVNHAKNSYLEEADE